MGSTARPWRTSIATAGVSSGNGSPPWGGRRFIADNSVWQRTEKTVVAPHWAAALRNGQIATCPIVRLEVLWSAKDLPNFDQIQRTLDALDNYPVNDDHWRAAERAIRRLIEIHHKRAVTFPDLLLAAVAEANGIAVLHYDSDFDLLRERHIFEIDTEWVAPRGTADTPDQAG